LQRGGGEAKGPRPDRGNKVELGGLKGETRGGENRSPEWVPCCNDEKGTEGTGQHAWTIRPSPGFRHSQAAESSG